MTVAVVAVLPWLIDERLSAPVPFTDQETGFHWLNPLQMLDSVCRHGRGISDDSHLPYGSSSLAEDGDQAVDAPSPAVGRHPLFPGDAFQPDHRPLGMNAARVRSCRRRNWGRKTDGATRPC